MRLLRRTDDAAAADAAETETRREAYERPEEFEPRDRVAYRWSPGDVIVVLAGAALAVVGIAALVRTQVNSTWYEPVKQVGGIDHTPLLAIIEAGVGALLVILGLARARALTVLACVGTAVAAAVAAVDPSRFSQELAIERWWAVTLAASAAALAVLSMLPWPANLVPRGSYKVSYTIRRQRGYGGAVGQH